MRAAKKAIRTLVLANEKQRRFRAPDTDRRPERKISRLTVRGEVATRREFEQEDEKAGRDLGFA
jgi:hypothetical protein